jgi:translation elongation factor EF-G
MVIFDEELKGPEVRVGMTIPEDLPKAKSSADDRVGLRRRERRGDEAPASTPPVPGETEIYEGPRKGTPPPPVPCACDLASATRACRCSLDVVVSLLPSLLDIPRRSRVPGPAKKDKIKPSASPEGRVEFFRGLAFKVMNDPFRRSTFFTTWHGRPRAASR